MKKIYILLMHTNTLPANVIKFVTRYKYSHVCISLEKDCNTVYSFGRKSLNNFLNGGFIVEKKNGDFFNKFNKSRCIIYEIEVSEKQYNKLRNIINYMVDNADDYKYDFLGLFIRFFKIPISFNKKFVCSTFIAYLLEKSDIYKFNKKSCLVVPKDYQNINEFREIYSGLYKMYV